jgi:CRP-like cAMP-binding protein
VFERRTGITSEDLRFLSGLTLFGNLPSDQIRLYLADTAVQRFARSAILFVQHQPATRFFIVLSGWVKIFRDTIDGHESVIGVFGRGESFAEAAVARIGEYPVTAAVIEDARLLTVPASGFMRHVRGNAQLATNLAASIASHLSGLVQHVEQLTARSSAERLAGFLVQLCPEGSDAAVVRFPHDKSLIAARLGMQPETFSRSLAKLRQHGVDTHGNEVRIASVLALQEFSDGGRSI